MTELTFSKTERKQIALRFGTLFKTITAKTWTTGTMGMTGGDDDDNDDYKEFEQADLRKLGKSKNKPKTLKMCLVGAAAYVNGPTEEEILALLATQIVLDDLTGDRVRLTNVWNWMGRAPRYVHLRTGIQNDAACALVLFEQLLMEDPFESDVRLTSPGSTSCSASRTSQTDHPP